MNEELAEFLRRNRACAGGIMRLEASGAETLADAWDKASPEDLVWAVTRPGVMSPEQRRQFLVMVLSSIEDKLTDPRSKNILDKLRTNSPITDKDKKAAWDADAAAEQEALLAAARSLWAAREAAWVAARETALAADAAAEAWAGAAADAAAEAVAAAEAAEAACSAADATAREAQAKWIRDNFVLNELNIK